MAPRDDENRALGSEAVQITDALHPGRLQEGGLYLEAATFQEPCGRDDPFEGDERYEWNYTPVERNGLRLRQMTQEQRDAAMRLMDTAYSDRGAKTAHQIILLEKILGEWEQLQNEESRWERAEDRYWFSVFGTPGSSEPWGWRAGGHHIGLSITVVDGYFVTSQPLFTSLRRMLRLTP
mgnify:CR=1 FL=1